MKNILIWVAVLLIGFSGLAQDKKPLLGKWKFKEVYQKDTIEPEKAERLTTMFTDMSLEINESEALLTAIGRTESAQWHFSETDPKIINVVSKTGKVTEMKIIKIDDKELVATFGKAGTFVFSKQ